MHRNSFISRDWDRFGCSAFASKGYDVVPVQVQPADHESFPLPVSKCFDQAALDMHLGLIRAEDFVLNLATYDDTTAWIYDWLTRKGVPYAVLTRGGVPYSYRGIRSANGIRDFMRHRAVDLHAWARLVLRGARRQSMMRRIASPRWWLRAGEAPMRNKYVLYPAIHRSEVLPMVHFDVETARALPARGSPDARRAVFLDQTLVHHPDFKRNGEHNPLQVDSYYAGLERCFQKVERDLGLEVVIAPHPRATKESLQQLGRKIAAEPTSRLVAESQLVICHYTTAVAYAVLFRRPVLFLTSDSMLGSNVDIWIAQASSWLGMRRVNMDRLPAKLAMPVVREADYRNFERKLLFEPGTLDWPQVVEKISKENHGHQSA